MSVEIEKRKLIDLRVVDLRSELEKRGIDKTGVKSLLIERLQKALKDEGHDPDEYLFQTSEKKTPVKRVSKRGEQDTESETQSNADENHDQDVDDEGDDELDKSNTQSDEVEVKVEPGNDVDAASGKKDGSEEVETVKPEPMDMDSEKVSVKGGGEEVVKEIKTEATDDAKENDSGVKGKEADGDKNVPEANGVDNEDSINLTIGEDDEKLLAEEEDSSHEKDAKDEGSLHKKDEAAGAQDKSNDKQASAGEDKEVKTDEQAASEDKAGADKNKSVSQVSGDQKAVKDAQDKKKAVVPAGSSRNLWVSGLSSSTRATDLKQVFSKYGKVIGAKVVTNARTPGARCYGYVTMATSEDATKCIQHLHRTELHGRMISVERAKGDSTGPPKKTENKVPVVKKVEEKKRHERKLSTSSKVDEKKEEDDKGSAPTEQAPKDETKPDVKPAVKVEPKNDAVSEEKAPSIKEEDKAVAEKQERERKEKERRRSADGSHHSRSPHRAVAHRVSPVRRPGVLTFAQIREARERQRLRERERELREEERRRREELARQREIERRNKEEAIRLEREKEKLRIERERIERERAELLRLERERQKLEREKLEREREELKRQQMRLEEARRTTKRPAEERREPYPDDRKRVATERRYESSGRFEESRSSRRERDTLVGRTADLPRREHASPDTGRGKERFERPPSFRSRDDHRSEADHRSKIEIRSRERYPESGKGEGRYTDRSGDTWHSGGGPAPSKPFSSVPSPRDTWTMSDRDRKGDSSQTWGRPMESSGSDRWVSGSGGPMSVVTRGPTMGPSLYSGPQGVSPSIPGMGLGLGGPSPYSGDRFDAYKQSMPLRKY